MLLIIQLVIIATVIILSKQYVLISQTDKPQCEMRSTLEHPTTRMALEAFYYRMSTSDSILYTPIKDRPFSHLIIIINGWRNDLKVSQGGFDVICIRSSSRISAARIFSIARPSTNTCYQVEMRFYHQESQTSLYIQDTICGSFSFQNEQHLQHVHTESVPCTFSPLTRARRCCALKQISTDDYKLCELRAWQTFYNDKCMTHALSSKRENEFCCRLQGTERYNCAVIMFPNVSQRLEAFQ